MARYRLDQPGLRQNSIKLVAAALMGIVGVMLCGVGPAWAGGAGGTSAPVQQLLNTACGDFGITNCPQLPLVNQVVVEIAALEGRTPAEVRVNPVESPPNGAIDAGTLVSTSSGTALSNPLAFVTSPGSLPVATDPSDPAANSFLSATTNLTTNMLSLTFDFHSRTQSFGSLSEGATVGSILLPLVVGDAASNVDPTDLSTPQLANLQILADPNTCPICVTTDITANLTGGPVTYQLSQLGLSFAATFGPTEQFTVGIPLLVPADFLNPTAPGPAYLFSASGYGFDPAAGLFDGIDPVANFLDANFLNDAGNPVDAAYADLAIAFDGSTILSDPVPAPEPATIALLGGGLASLAWLRRRRQKAG